MNKTYCKSSWNVPVRTLCTIFLMTLLGCGGGGGGGSTSVNTLSLSGVAAVGTPIVNANISVICAAGNPLSTTTSNTGTGGAWQVTLSGQTFPCAVEVSNGTISGAPNAILYHSIAIAAGTVNVTPLTDLMVANIVGTATPSVWFSGLATNHSTLSSITQTQADTALAALGNALSGLSQLASNNPITTQFIPTTGNVIDGMLTALKSASNTTGVTYATLLGEVATSTATTTTVPAGFETNLTAAYATASGSYTVGGTVSGLNSRLSNSVVLQDNGGNTTTLTANGAFTFSGTISNGATYAVTVASQPSGQNCTVTSGSGTIVGSNITNIAVNCLDNNYNVGAAVTSLSNGSSVVLQNNGGDNLTVTADGTSNFNTTVPSGSTYDVTVLTQPNGETCTVTNGRGTVTNANVVASITCSPNTYTIGGTVSGLATGHQVTLQNNGGNSTSISVNGSFVFSTAITNGSGYAVVVSSQPSGQNCTVTNGSGTVSNASITNVAVTCSTTSAYNVSAIVTGLLSNTSVVLQNNGGSNLTFTANGTANFNSTLSSGSLYAVTVLTQPANETCTVTNGSGTISNANVTVSVACASNVASNPAGTGSGALTTVPTTTGNVIPLVVDAGPPPLVATGQTSINVGYVSVTVCTPGTSGNTAACQTIDHVVLDTGSYGLRLLNSQLSSSLNLPAATNVGGHAVGECLTFVIGVTWGSVRLADVYVGGEVARSIPIQDIGDHPAGNSTIPSACTNSGSIQNTQTTLGANGILGVGNFVNDCDACLTQVIPATYYDCTSSRCASSTVTVSQMVKNPVAEFQNPTTGAIQDNNGEMITLPAVGSGGSTGITGSVTFGIGTQTNNALGVTTVYPTDAFGNFITHYKGTVMSSSFLDSGSNGFFFNDNTIATCQDGWYCPFPSPLQLTATNSGATGSSSGTFNFSLVNADNLFGNTSIVAGNIGAPISASFDWGLPFFYGRTVFTAISGKSTPGGVGPYWAY